MGCVCKLGIGRTHSGYEAVNFVGIFDAPQRLTIGAVTLDAGADINGQR